MSNCIRWIAIAICLIAIQTQSSFGKGSGHSHGQAARHSSGPAAFAPWPYTRGDNGIWLTPGAGFGYAGAGWGGWGGFGYGPGWGSGYGWADSGYYYPESVPYFNLYPPVYYGYDAGAITPKSTLRSSWLGNSADSADAATPPAAAPVRPLRIANPYYTAGK